MIYIALFDDHKLVSDGLAKLLNDVSDIKVAFVADHKHDLYQKLQQHQVHLLLLNLYEVTPGKLNQIVKLNIDYPRLKILVYSVIDTEDAVLKTVKAGAKGFLGKDSGQSDLIEAIYTLRNGHDYFSKSITHLLLNRYIGKLKTDEPFQNPGLNLLSERQIEILKMWGNSNSNQEIAEKLFISVRTVESHKNHIMQKLNLKSTVDLVKFAIKNNIIEI